MSLIMEVFAFFLWSLLLSGHCIFSNGASSHFYKSLEKDQDLTVWEREGWVKMQQVERETELRLVFALKQRNVDLLENTLMEVSDPESPQYGNYLNIKEITQIVRPSDDTLWIVYTWLDNSGVKQCLPNANRDFLTCTVSRELAQRLLVGTEFYYFMHPHYQGRIIRSLRRYYVPDYVASHLDFVGGIHRFPKLTSEKADQASDSPAVKKSLMTKIMEGIRAGIGGVYPGILRQRYNASSAVGSHPNNSQSVAQFDKEYYKPTDLNKFMETFVGAEYPHLSTVTKVVGPNSGRAGLEASLDIQYIMGVGANVPTWFWSTAGTTPGTHGNVEPYLEWIINVGNTQRVPWVHSVSYGRDETELSIAYMTRLNNEFMKAGTRGLTILFASGDNGAACEGGKFAPEFPASSPYITSVGGTKFLAPVGVTDEHGDIISGGGFSNIFKRTVYQSSKVESFLNTAGIPPQKYFNASGRAYPDISAVCRHFWVVVNGNISPGVTGTSASTPTVAGLISLLNDIRFKHGQPSMGFINPFLYKYASALYDVTQGCHLGCMQGGSLGFCSVEGWDPVTGNGTPNFPELVRAAMAVFK